MYAKCRTLILNALQLAHYYIIWVFKYFPAYGRILGVIRPVARKNYVNTRSYTESSMGRYGHGRMSHQTIFAEMPYLTQVWLDLTLISVQQPLLSSNLVNKSWAFIITNESFVAYRMH